MLCCAQHDGLAMDCGTVHACVAMSTINSRVWLTIIRIADYSMVTYCVASRGL